MVEVTKWNGGNEKRKKDIWKLKISIFTECLLFVFSAFQSFLSSRFSRSTSSTTNSSNIAQLIKSNNEVLDAIIVKSESFSCHLSALSCLSQTAHTVKHANNWILTFQISANGTYTPQAFQVLQCRKLFVFVFRDELSLPGVVQCQLNLMATGGGWKKEKRYTRNVDSVVMCVYFFPSRADCRLVEWKFNIWCQNDKFTVQFTSMWFSAYCFHFFHCVKLARLSRIGPY